MEIFKFPSLKQMAIKEIQDFISSEQKRHIDNTKDLNLILSIFTTVTDKFELEKFVDAYLDEIFLRNVMEWYKSYSYYDMRKSLNLENIT